MRATLSVQAYAISTGLLLAYHLIDETLLVIGVHVYCRTTQDTTVPHLLNPAHILQPSPLLCPPLAGARSHYPHLRQAFLYCLFDFDRLCRSFKPKGLIHNDWYRSRTFFHFSYASMLEAIVRLITFH